MSEQSESQRDTFIAVQVPPIVAVQLASAGRMLQLALRETVAVRTTGEHHITLRYIGSSTTHRLQTLMTNFMLHGAEPVRAFELTLDSIDAFPNLEYPEIIWASIGGDTQGIREAQAVIDEVTTDDGVAPAHYPFTPHITIAKLPAPGLSPQERASVTQCLEAVRRDPPFYQPHCRWEVTELHAMARNTGRSDTRFKKVAGAKLKTPDERRAKSK